MVDQNLHIQFGQLKKGLLLKTAGHKLAATAPSQYCTNANMGVTAQNAIIN
jgi:hypothetical protein